MFRIATRTAFRHLKKERRWPDRLRDDRALDEMGAADAAPAEIEIDQLLQDDHVTPASRAVLVLHFKEGMTLVERGRNACFHVPAFARQVFDVTGAGDTVIGTLAACLAAGATMREAAVLANVAASVVVGEVGTAPITAEKLLRAAEMHDRTD